MLIGSRSPWQLALVAALIVAWHVQATAQVSRPGEFPKTDFSKHSIKMDEVFSGGPPKDGIPAIDEPKFVSVQSAAEWIDAREPVISVTHNGATKAYPIQIMTWHEIVNDELGGLPIAITFCPLCNSSIVFHRKVGESILDFGTTGRLRKSDMLMYDRQTETWWQQLIGEGVIGELTGMRLEQFPADIVAFGDFSRAYPEAKVLSKDTGHYRNYGQNPYRGYDSVTDRPFMFFDEVDSRLAPMDRVLNVSIDDKHKLYPFSQLRKTPVINDEFMGRPIVVFSKPGTLSALDDTTIAESRLIPSATVFERTMDARTLTFDATTPGAFTDRETGSSWNMFGRATAGPMAGKQLAKTSSALHFAFAWLAFNPASTIYGQ